ncbi:MAG: hypothetical protein ACPL4E_00825 [Thermoproteota archaeon]
MEFNGFRLRMNAWGNLDKAIEIIQFFKERTINVEVDLSREEV